MKDLKNFLIFGHNYIGDVLMLTPAIRALKMKFPESRITVVASRQASNILKRNPDIWKIVETENIRGIKGITGILKLFATLKNIKRTNKIKFFTCINFLTSFKFSVLGFLLSEQQIGEDKALNNIFLSHKIKFDKNLHNSYKSLKFIEPFYAGEKHFGEFKNNYIYETEENDIKIAKDVLKNYFGGQEKEIFAENFKFVLFSPGSTRKTKEANPEIFSRLADYLNKKGFYVVITGSIKDTDTSRNIYNKIENKSMSKDLTGLTDIFTLGGLISESSLAVCVDNGTMHLSSAIKTPLISLFGSTDPSVCGPADDNACIIDKKGDCYHCFYKKCPRESFGINGYPDCTGSIMPEDLINEAKRFLQLK